MTKFCYFIHKEYIDDFINFIDEKKYYLIPDHIPNNYLYGLFSINLFDYYNLHIKLFELHLLNGFADVEEELLLLDEYLDKKLKMENDYFFEDPKTQTEFIYNEYTKYYIFISPEIKNIRQFLHMI